MEVSFLVDQDIGILYSGRSVFGVFEVSKDKFGDGIVFLRVHSVLFEEDGDQGILTNEDVPEETVEGFLFVAILLHGYFLDPLLEHLGVADPEGDSVVFQPLPASFLWLELPSCLLLVERVKESRNLHTGERFALHDGTLSQDEY